MQSPPEIRDEARRLTRLHRLDLLDTASEAVLDHFTELAAAISGMPIALISLIDRDRQWFKSAVGLPQGGQTHRDISFCGHAIASDDLFEVINASEDPRFSDNPLVTGHPNIAHYAGTPLVMPGGERIGTLCVIGDKPGHLDAHTRDLLAKLARSIVSVLLLRESERDLVSRLKAEGALRESEARFRTIANAMPQMVWSTLPDGRHDYFNERWYEFTGLPEGSTDDNEWLAAFHPDDRPRAWQAWHHSLATGDPYEIEYRLRHRSGEYRWVLGRALPVRDDAHHILRWMGTCTDIHDLKRTREELQESNRHKDEFLAMLAHELRNPLAPIATAAQLLRLAPDHPDQVRRSGELIARQVAHMTELVDDLLDVSRVTRGLVQIEHQPVAIEQVVQDALEQTRPQMEAHRHRVELQMPDTSLAVLGDRVRLVQVLTNLLNNSAKYTPDGGQVRVAVRALGPQVEIAVTDNGCGMEASLLPHVFDLFTQARRTPDRSQGGLGVGLALVRTLVNLHGGTVRAESAGPGRGSTFVVCLPTAQEPCGARKEETTAAAAPPTRLNTGSTASPAPPPPTLIGNPGPGAATENAAPALKILVVDDNVDASQMLGLWLEAQGHQVRVSHEAKQALEMARQERADIYILDIGLPGMDGNELARRLRQEPGNRDALLIALTGYGQSNDILRSRDAGFDHHFVKPADPQRLEAVLELRKKEKAASQPGPRAP